MPVDGADQTVARLLAAQDWRDLEARLPRGLADPEETLDRLRRFAALVLLWNRHVSNLISENDERRIVTRHLRESIEPAAALVATGAQRWIDFGSGAGFPAIPLSMLGVGSHWTLVESRRPKALFMRRAIQDLGLRGIEVVHSRVEALLRSPDRPRFAGFTSRATLPFTPTLEFAYELLEPEGTAFLWTGVKREAEMEAERSWADCWTLEGIDHVGEAQTAILRLKRRN